MQLYQDIIEQINERNIEARATANISNVRVNKFTTLFLSLFLM